MNKLIFFALGLGLAFSGLASAGTLTEPFNDPFEDWESRWFFQNSNAANFYGPTDGRGNNPTGIWINDNDSFIADSDILIQFNPAFAAALTSLSLDVAIFNVQTPHLRFFDASGATLEDLIVFSGNFGVTSVTGIGGFEFYGGSVEGNTSIDNVTVNFTPEPASFGLLLVGGAALLVRRRVSCRP